MIFKSIIEHDKWICQKNIESAKISGDREREMLLFDELEELELILDGPTSEGHEWLYWRLSRGVEGTNVA